MLAVIHFYFDGMVWLRVLQPCFYLRQGDGRAKRQLAPSAQALSSAFFPILQASA